MRTVRCQCGEAWVPEGMVCEQCEAFGDDAPLNMIVPDYTPEDRRLDAMDEEAAQEKAA